MTVEFIEPSLFPKLVGDRPLGTDQEPCMRAELKALAESLKPLYSKIQYGRVNAEISSILMLSRGENCLTKTPALGYDEYGNDKCDHWQHSGSPDDQTIEPVEGYIDAYYEVEIDGVLQPALRVVQDITSTGYEDMLVLVEGIKSIETIPQLTTEILAIVANNQAGMPLNDERYLGKENLESWSEVVEAYFDDGPEYRTVWTPATGVIQAWDC